MMQPELGRKIAELRKAKGFTQDELVQLCNLSIRTLQRIESGEVMPRSYTIKSIFAALDYDAFSSSTKSSNDGESIGMNNLHWLEQVYRYIFDLFNLKTNAMKKLTILSIPVITAFLILFSITHFSSAQNINQSKLAGRWQLCSEDGSMVLVNTPQGDCYRIKVVTEKTFVVLDVNPNKKGTVSVYFLGSYNTDGNKYNETIENTSQGLLSFKGITNTFQWDIKGDILYLKGINNTYDEIWKRITN